MYLLYEYIVHRQKHVQRIEKQCHKLYSSYTRSCTRKGKESAGILRAIQTLIKSA